MRDGTLNISVATLTRKRPEMLSSLLTAWENLNVPPECNVQYLVIENDDESQSIEMVQTSAAAGLNVVYELETELGIPFARNKAARQAIIAGSDLLVFIDDDETPAQNWLVKLVEGYRASSAVLMGAPLRAQRPEGDLGWWQELIYQNVLNRYKQKEKRAASRAGINETPGVTVVTNNWLAEVDIFKNQGIWFDEKMRFTGGTDAKFYREARDRGIPTGWIKDAFVYETITPERLSFSYQVARGRDQATTNLRRKFERSSVNIVTTSLLTVAKLILAVFLLLATPLSPKHLLLPLARTIGWLLGWASAITGKRSKLYVKSDGN